MNVDFRVFRRVSEVSIPYFILLLLVGDVVGFTLGTG